MPSWLAYIVASQHYGKPPLYVNTLALFIHLVGRERLLLAVGLLAAVGAALLGIAVFVLVRRATSFWFGLLAMLAIAALPSVARWAPDAYPDLQLALCVVWVIALLGSEPHFLWLGLAFAAGLLAKSTFPFYVALPLAWWWWQGRRAGIHRTRTLVKAAVIGIAIAAVWYASNLSESFAYARTAYSGAYSAHPVFWQTFTAWLQVISGQGIGWIMLLVGLAGALVFLLPKRPQRIPFPRDPVVLLLLGGVPVLLVALTSPAADNRRTLPSFVLVTLAELLVLYWIARRSKVGELLLVIVAAGVFVQWTLTKLAEIPSSAERLQSSSAGQSLIRLQPAVIELQPATTEAVAAVIRVAEAMGDAAPTRWYVSGNDGYFNVPRLQLAAKIRRLPVTFQWAEYFEWPELEVQDRLDKITGSSAILVFARPQVMNPSGEYMARYVPLVERRLGDFHKLAGGSSVSIYATRLAYEAMTADVHPVYANYSDRIQISGVKIDGRALTLRIKLLAPLPCKFKLMVHAFGADDQMHPWDQKIDPQLCKWQPGDVRVMTFQLPEDYLKAPYRLQLGFFDEADREHNWPPLPLLTGGGNSICLPSPDLRVLCPVGAPLDAR